MLYRLSALLLALLALQIAAPGNAAPEPFSSPSTIEEILVAEQHLATALATGHDANVDRLVADDARMTSATGQFFDGASWEARMLGRARRELPVPTAIDIRLYRNVALVHGRATVADPAPRDLYVMRAWVDSGDTWELAAQHTTDITTNARAEPPTFATLGQKIPAGPTHTAPDASAQEQAVVQAMLDSHRRYWAKDVEGYRRTIGLDLIRSAETGVRPGSELVAYMESNPRLPGEPPAQLEMWARVFGSVAIGGWLDAGSNSVGAASRNRFTVVLVWRDVRWQIVQIQSTGVLGSGSGGA
jgi:hypothetical protein